MAKPMLSVARLREVLHYDPVTGVFTWLIDPNEGRGATRAGDVAGFHMSDGYRRIGIDGAHYAAHRIAWLYMHGGWPPDRIDHRDGVRDHNWIDNLRPATYAQNNQNRRSVSRCGLLGAHWHKNRRRWISQIVSEGRVRYLGSFATAEEAHAAYSTAKAKLHSFQPIPRNKP